MLDSSVPLDNAHRNASHRESVEDSHLCCLFSSAVSQRVGCGAYATRRTCTIYWFVRQLDRNSYGIRSINDRSLPAGKETIIGREELMVRFIPEIQRFEEVLLPALRQFRDRLNPDDLPYVDAAEAGTLLDEGNVRSLFALGHRYFLDGRPRKGREIVNQILQIKQDFVGKNQFLFNEFGIALRKAGQPSSAVGCYRKALEYISNDDHLHYNLARSHYENGQWWDCIHALGKCYEYNPNLDVAGWLVELTVALSRDSELRIRYEKPPVPEGVARRAAVLVEAMEFANPRKMKLAPEAFRQLEYRI